MNKLWWIAMWAAAVGCSGCAPAGPVVLEADPATVEPSADVSDLATVLAGVATRGGCLLPAELRQLSDSLDAQLAKMAVSGPTATPALYPTDPSRWAYWLNARMAWSMKLALLAGCAKKPSQVTMGREFHLDGRVMSLAAIDQLLLAEARRAGEFRLAACAAGVRLDFAPLPRRPFSGEDLGRQLDAQLSRLVLDERRFVVDVGARRVRLPRPLWSARQCVIDQYHRDYGPCDATVLTALRPYVDEDARLRLEQCLGYEVVSAGLRSELALPLPKFFHPGRVGRVPR